MVAVIAGNGLGLDNTSLTQLGQASGGQGAIGQGRVNQYLNVANGNLVLQGQDQGLIFDGTPLNALRTYNSQGQLSGNQGWLFGFGQTVNGLSGTVNTVGSTIVRTGDDGSAVTYTYNATLGVYVSSGQSGAQDTLAWNAASSTWSWTESSTRQQEIYNAHGQLTALSNAATGASYNFSYSNGMLSQVVAGDGDTLILGYNTANQLVNLSIQEVPPGQSAAVTRQQVSYSYDSQGRLSVVTTTLGSDTNNGLGSYSTAYGYDGTSDRVASVSQSDGTTVSYTYGQSPQGLYRVTGIITGSGAAAQAITLSYGNGTTTLTNALGQAWVYSYNAAGQLISIAAPAVNGANPTTQYSYDSSGNLLQQTDANGAMTNYGYDTNGNVLSVENPDGSTISYTYNADDQVLSRTTYTVPAQGRQGQSGYVAPSGTQTTYYIYDTSDRLNYLIDATGAVTEHDYTATAAGIYVLATTRQYMGATYGLTGLSPSTPPTLANMQAWVASNSVQSTLSQMSRVDYTYDLRGQWVTKTQWDTVDANGNGVSDAATAITTATHDAQGRLLQTATERGATRTTLDITSYTYDGLGRILSTKDAIGNVTSYIYIDSSNTLTITRANGSTLTQVRNSAGLLISTEQSSGPQSNPTTTLLYNAAGQSVATINGQGNTSYTFYDATGRVTGTVDASGLVTAFSYDASGNRLQTIQYATAINTAGWVSNAALTAQYPAALPVPAASSGDHVSLVIYDAFSRPVATVDSTGAVTVTVYDATGHVTAVTHYATLLTAAQVTALGGSPTLTALQADISASSSDRTSRTIYDANSHPIATIGTGGNVTMLTYDASGNAIVSMAYATVLTSAQMTALGTAPTLSALQADLSPSSSDQKSLAIYDTNNHPVASIDAVGNVTMTTYNSAGQIIASAAMTTPLTAAQLVALGNTPTLVMLQGFLDTNAGGYSTPTIYDANGNAVGVIDAGGKVTITTYNGAGNATSATQYATALAVAQIAALGSAPTLSALQAAVSPSAADTLTLTIYDANNRIVGQVGANLQATITTYDNAGNVIARRGYEQPISAATEASLGGAPTLAQLQGVITPNDSDQTYLAIYDASNHLLATVNNGQVTTNNYNGAGNIANATTYATVLTAAQITALGNAPTLAALQADLTHGANDTVITMVYDASNRIAATVDNSGNVTTTTYDSAGNISAKTYGSNTLTTAQVAALGSAPTLAVLLADLSPSVGDSVNRTIYDGNNRPVATIDDQGHVTTTTYDAAGHVAATIAYGNPVTVTQRAALSTSPTLATLTSFLTSSANDVAQVSIYDASNHLVGMVDANRNVSTMIYDVSGHLVSTTHHTPALSLLQAETLAALPTMAALQADLNINAGAHLIQTIYDASGHVIATIGADGTVNTSTYDASGNMVATTRYATPLAAGRSYITTLSALLAQLSPSSSDLTTHTIYDLNNRPVATIDTTGHVTTTTYNVAGSVASTTSFTTALTTAQLAELGGTPTQVALQAIVNATSHVIYDAAGQAVAIIDPQGAVSYNFYDADGRVAGTVDEAGALTAYAYDADGHRTQTIQYATSINTSGWVSSGVLTSGFPSLLPIPAANAQDRITQVIYDVAGRVVATIGATGQVSTSTFDGAGNTVSSTSYATALTTSQRTLLGSAPGLKALQADLSASANDRTISAIYDADNRVAATIDAQGYVTTTLYDAAGNVATTMAYATPLTAQQRINLGSTPTLATLQSDLTNSPGDQVTRNYHDGQGRQVAQVDADGFLTITTYDETLRNVTSARYATSLTAAQLSALNGHESAAVLVGLLGAIAANEVTRSTYNADNQLLSKADPDGVTTTYFYDNMGLVHLTMAMPLHGIPKSTSTTYDAFGNVIAKVNENYLTSTMTVDALGRRTSITDVEGNATYTYYDAAGRVIYSVQGEPNGSVSNSYGEVIAYTYNAFGEVLTETRYAAKLNLASAGLTAATPLATVAALVNGLSAPGGDANAVKTMTYTGDGQISTMTDGDGFQTTYSYDAFGDLVQTTQQLSSPGTALASGNSTTTQYGYDARGERTSEIDALGTSMARHTSNDYDAFGRVIRRTDGNGNTATYSYDPLGRQIDISQSVQGRVLHQQATYDAFGQVLTQTDALGHATTYQYDVANRTTIVTTPDGVKMTTIEDGFGHAVSVTDSAGNTTTYSYDGVGELVTVTDALNVIRSTSLQSGGGRIVDTTDQAGEVVVTYDAAGRVLTRVVDPKDSVDPNGLNLVTTYTYDGVGRELSVTDPSGVVTYFSYDASGRVLSQVQDAGAGELNLTTTYSYDGQGRVLMATVGSGTSGASTTQYVYDALGRLVQKTVDPTGLQQTTSYSYDANNNLVQLTDPSGNATYTIYNEANEAVYSIAPTGAQGSSQGIVTQYGYDADGHVVATHVYSTPVSVSSLGALANGGVAANLAIGATLVSGAATASDAISYQVFDADGRLQYTIDPTGAVTETRYNALGQVSETLAYATPVSVSSTLGAALFAGTVQSGDLQNALGAAGDSDTTTRVTYTYYDGDGRVVYTVTPNLISGVLGAAVSQLQYDLAGRVVSTIVYGLPLPMSSVGASATTASIAQALAQVETASTTRSTQSVYNGANEKVAQIDPNGNVSYTFYDANGRVSATVDAAGGVVQYTRDTLGRAIQQVAYIRAVSTAGWLANGAVTVTVAATMPLTPDGRLTQYTYDALGRLSSVTHYSQPPGMGSPVDGDTLTYFYDMASRVVHTTDVDLSGSAATRATSFFYDANGRTIGTLDANGYLTTRSYDAAGRLVQTVAYATATNPSLRGAYATLTPLVPASSGSDQVTTNYYDARGNVSGVLDADGYFTQYTYDQNNRQLTSTRYGTVVSAANRTSLVAITAVLAGTAAETTTRSYDTYGDVLSAQNAEGTVTQYAYDSMGRVLQESVAPGTTDARIMGTTYDAFGNIASTTDGVGAVSRYAYDLSGNKTSITDASGNSTWYVYDLKGRLVYTVRGIADASGKQNALGEVSETDYDVFGDALKTTVYAGLIPLSAGFAPTVASMTSAVTAMPGTGHDQDDQVRYQYDMEGNVVFKSDGDFNVTQFAYDGFGDLITRTRQQIGSFNFSSASTLSRSGVHIFSRPAPITNFITKYSYDALGHMTDQFDESISSSNVTTNLRELQWSYDAFGRAVAYVDGNGATTTYGYDSLNRELTQSLSVSGAVRTVATTYDAYGRVLSKADALGLMTLYAYDDVHRSITVTSPGGLVTTTVHSREGQDIAITDAGGNTTSYHYDGDGRLLQTSHPDGGVVVNHYDSLGNLIQTQDADGHVITYAYDAAGRVLTQTVDPAGLKLVTTYTYDGRGLKISEVDPNGAVTTYDHDGNGNVGTMVEDAGAAATALNVSTSYVYNINNEIINSSTTSSLDPSGSSNLYQYDGLGRLINEQLQTGQASSIKYSYDANGNVVKKIDGSGSTYYFYNEANERIYALTDVGGGPGVEGSLPDFGAITQYWYNADGQLTGTRQYTTTISSSSLSAIVRNLPVSSGGIEAALSSVASVVIPGVDDPVSYKVYNSSGQLQYTIDPSGAVVEARYNSAGQVSETLAYAQTVSTTPALVAALLAGTVSAKDIQSILASAQNSEASARITYTYYDSMGRVRFSISNASVGGQGGGLVKETRYDADGNVVAQLQYGTLIAPSSWGGTASTSSISQLLASITNVQVTQAIYDQAGRQVYVVDALHQVTETRYDGDNRVTWTLHYANAIPAATVLTVAAVAAAVQVANPDATSVRGVGSVYDKAGNVIQTLDTLSTTPSAIYTYDAIGLKTSYTNRDGQTWTYAYDSYGNLIRETSPAVAVATYGSDGSYTGATQQALVTFYSYYSSGLVKFKTEAYGLAQARQTQYSYDNTGNLTRISQVDPGVINPATGLLVATGNQLVNVTTYSALGQAVSNRVQENYPTYKVYDLDGRLAYDIDANGYVTGYQYDAYGEQTAVTRYAQAIDHSLLANGSQSPSKEQVQALLVTSSADRVVSTTYDSLGNKLSVIEPAVTYTKSDGSTAVGSPTTTYTYDAYGNVTSQAVLVQGDPAQGTAIWATTYNYYDALGHKTMSVDPMGYVSTWSYNAFGDVTSTTDWATAISTSGLVAGGAQPANPPAGNPATTGADRTTQTTYDNDGRKLSESVLRTYVNASGATVQGFVTTTYGHDGENRVTTVTQNGQTITTQYDALGRILSVTAPQERVLVSNWQALLAANPVLDLTSASLYIMASQVMSYTYDAFGNKLVQTQSSTGSSQAVSTYYQYDNANRLVASLTPLDGSLPNWTSSQAKYMTYDSSGNLLSTISTLTGEDNSTVTVQTSNVYDDDNLLIGTTTSRSGIPTPDSITKTQYNAFGEVISAGDGVIAAAVTSYDNAGCRLTATDPKTGVLHTYGYNLAHQLIIDAVPLSASGGTVWTKYTRDLDGRAIAEQVPSTNAATGENAGTLSAAYDHWGNVLSSTDAAGNTTTYTYNERNQVITQAGPAVSVVDMHGVSTLSTPTKTSAYDINDNLVAVTDENGNVTRTTYDTVRQLVQTTDGAGATSYVAYDALGNEVADQDGIGHVTFKNVDALGRVVQQGDFVLSADGKSRVATWRQAYVLDQGGNRLVTYDGMGSAYLQSGDATNAALHANFYGYDSQGRVQWSQGAAQRAASTFNVHGLQGGSWTQAIPNADFSQGATGWTPGPGWSVGNFGTGPYGPWTASFGGSGSSTAFMFNNNRVPVVPGQSITAWGWFVVNGDHGGGAIQITWFDANGNSLGGPNSQDIVSAGNGAGKSTLTGTAPAGAAWAEIGVGATNDSGSTINTSGVGWSYVPPAWATSTGADGSPIVTLPSGSFSQQPTNPDFENGDSGWNMGTGWSTHTQSNTSNGSWVANYTGNGSALMVNQDRVPVTAGQSISASIQVSLYLAPSGAAASGAVAIQWFDAAGNVISTSMGNVVNNDSQGDWRTSSLTATAPPGAAFAALAAYGSANGIGNVNVDAAVWNYQYIAPTPTGVVQTTYIYDRDGNLASETTADGDTETWVRDTYGRVLQHTDLSGARYNYNYDPASGQLMSESDNWSPGSQNQSTPAYVTAPLATPNSSTRTYYADGQLATLTYADGSVYSYSYDANGNQTRQESTTVDGNNKAVHTVTQTTYDSHNRISHVVATDVIAGTTTLDETFSYDAAGNRREIVATSGATTTNAWYTYDGDNRVQVSAGALQNGVILVTNAATSYALGYDGDGNAITRSTVMAGGDTSLQRSYFDARGELIRADYAVDITAGGTSRGIEELRTYDAAGHVTSINQFYALGTTLGARPPSKVNPDSGEGDPGTTGTNVGGEMSSATIDRYDAVGRLAEEQNFGHASNWDGTGGDVTVPVSLPTPDATTYGSLSLQNAVVYQGPNGSAGYDAMGHVASYQYRDASGRVDQYAVTYLRKDDYLEAATSGQNVSGTANVRPATDESYYDNRGNRLAIAQHTQYAGGTVADTVRVFAYDGNGQIIERRDGTASGATLSQGSNASHQNQHYVYVNGQQVAHVDEGGTLDVLDQVTAFSSGSSSGGYVVQAGDTLKSIAQALYGNASLWYVIAQANALSSDNDLAIGQSLTTPAVTTNANDATTFKPYNPGEIAGSTTPNLPTIAPPPPPTHQHCNVLAEIIVIAVTVVATVFTAGATSELLASEIGAAFVAGAAGSVAGQLAGDVLGVHQGIDLGQVITSGATAGVAAGVGSELGQFSDLAAESGQGLNFTGNVIQGAATYVGADAAAKITGQSAHFSWAGLVANSVSAGVSGELGATTADVLQGRLGVNYWGNIAASAAGGVVNRETSLALGDRHVQSWQQIGETVGGNALANAGVADYRAYQSQQAMAALNSSDSNLLANTQGGLNAALWQQSGGFDNGQPMLDAAWQHAQNSIDGSFATGVQASLGSGSWANSSLVDTGYGAGNTSNAYGGVTYDPTSNIPLARYFVQPDASDDVGSQEVSASSRTQEMQRIRDIVPLINGARDNPSVDQSAWSQARVAGEYATNQVISNAPDAESSVARAELLAHGLIATNLEAVQVSAQSDAGSQDGLDDAASSNTAGASTGAVDSLWSYGTGSVLSGLNDQLRDTVPGSARDTELRRQVALAGSVSRSPLDNMQAQLTIQELGLSRLQGEIASYGAPLPTLRAYDPVIDERAQRQVAQLEMLTGNSFAGGFYGASVALGASDQRAAQIATAAGLATDAVMAAGAVSGIRLGSVPNSGVGRIEFAGEPQEFVTDLGHVTGKSAQARNQAISAIIKEDFPSLNLSYQPQYSPFIRTGIAQEGGGTQIGKANFSSRESLRNVIVHEELHHRWWERGVLDHHPRGGAKEFRFYETIRRYERMRGWGE
ncbi:LysM peptidoglycan-binding domain-containing protein [Dyella silvatica]|uniref:LysM peptidoglycan-binding domain-containing protein n=1 Tax=Dyella silvatica TaxID=2992128 RepID=UPI00224F0D45|nr:LysM peptidoglycan-binding domain-containing protein [Dyella silvatica]